MEPYKPADKLVAILGLSLAVGAVLCLVGCEDSAKKVASYHPPVIQAATVQQPAGRCRPARRAGEDTLCSGWARG